MLSVRCTAVRRSGRTASNGATLFRVSRRNKNTFPKLKELWTCKENHSKNGAERAINRYKYWFTRKIRFIIHWLTCLSQVEAVAHLQWPLVEELPLLWTPYCLLLVLHLHLHFTYPRAPLEWPIQTHTCKI